jgi:hypothetical protein
MKYAYIITGAIIEKLAYVQNNAKHHSKYNNLFI